EQRVVLGALSVTVVHLRIVKTEDAAKGARDLVLHHGDETGGGGAEAVEKDDGMRDGGAGAEVVEPRVHAVVLATGGIGGACAEKQVDERTVGVVCDGERKIRGGWGDIGWGREGRVTEKRRSGDCVSAVHILREGSGVFEDDAS